MLFEDWQQAVSDADFMDENCENCRFLTGEDTCGNPQSVYFRRPVVYRDGDEVLQTGWCDLWETAAMESRDGP